jgi:hypothetical protein
MSPHDIPKVAIEAMSNDYFLSHSSYCGICQCAESADAGVNEGISFSRTAVLKTKACGHIFHKICLSTWFDTQISNDSNATCPMCRHVLAEPSEMPTSIATELRNISEARMEDIQRIRDEIQRDSEVREQMLPDAVMIFQMMEFVHRMRETMEEWSE